MGGHGLDPETVRDTAFRLRNARTTLATIGDDLVFAVEHAALGAEAAAASELRRELDDEIDILARLLDARASAMELADSGFSTGGSWLMQTVATLASALELSLDDDIGSTGSPDEIRAHYRSLAFERAGIDPNGWQPDLGLDANSANVALVYEYYGDLYRDDPDTYWWAGMAAMIGPSFFGGFQDLETFADLFEGAADVADKLKYVTLPTANPLMGELAEMTADEIADELRWYQERLLHMQREIFLDMATAHEAYRDGGMLAIERLYENDPYGFEAQTVGAWRQIDAGRTVHDVDLIASGNATLLLREQKYVIDDDYQDMLHRPVTGEVTTYLMTAVGAPSVPGADSYPQFNPLEVAASQYVGSPREIPIVPFFWHQSIPHAGVEGTVTLTTPLPDGNIANFEDRWDLIEHDTLPVWTDLAENQQDRVLRDLAVPVAERAESFTILQRADDLLVWGVTGWDIDVDLEAEVGW